MSSSPAGCRRPASIDRIKGNGAKLICFAPALALAKKLIRSGVDALVIEGMEAGGHIGPVSTSVLAQEILPPLAAEVPIFVAGGIGHGGLIAGYLEMGAVGVQLGTRFVCATECIAHPNFKKAFIRASARDAITSVQIDPRLPVIPVRALKNREMESFAAKQREVAHLLDEAKVEMMEAQLQIEHYWAGALRRAVIEGDVETGSVMAGQSVGMVKDEAPVAEILAQLDRRSRPRAGAALGLGERMTATDAAFAGSIPRFYDRYLGPAAVRALCPGHRRARRARSGPRRILETAAGTGIVTAALARALPEAEIVATDLNQAMLDVAAARLDRAERLASSQADAQALPFDDASFDARRLPVRRDVLPRPRRRLSRGAARAEAGRPFPVQRLGPDRGQPGHRTRRRDAVAALFPDDPPSFFAPHPLRLSRQGPHRGRFARSRLRRGRHRDGRADAAASPPRDAAIGFVQGTPLRAEIEARGADLDEATDAAAAALASFDGKDAPMSAHVVSAGWLTRGRNGRCIRNTRSWPAGWRWRRRAISTAGETHGSGRCTA